MKSFVKILIIGVIIIAIGAGILVTTFAVNGWSIKPKFKMETFTAQDENYTVDIDIGASVLKTVFYDGDKIEISYPASKSYKTDIKEKDGKLSFDSRIKWFAHFMNFSGIPETVVKLPKDKAVNLVIDVGAGSVSLASGVYGNVKIDVSAGKLEASGITCTSLDCDVSAGKLNISSLSCPNIKADVSAGELSIGVNGLKSEYTITASVSAGSCNVRSQTGTTDKKLKVDCSAGKITVNFILDEQS